MWRMFPQRKPQDSSIECLIRCRCYDSNWLPGVALARWFSGNGKWLIGKQEEEAKDVIAWIPVSELLEIPEQC